MNVQVFGHIQCIPIKRKRTFYQWDINLLSRLQDINALNYNVYASLSRAYVIFYSFDTITHDDISMHEWKGQIWQLRHVNIDLCRIMVHWVHKVLLPKFRLANAHCQNKESKQKKPWQETKGMLMNVFVNTSLWLWNVADPVKPLNSHSAQINFDIAIWPMVRDLVMHGQYIL